MEIGRNKIVLGIVCMLVMFGYSCAVRSEKTSQATGREQPLRQPRFFLPATSDSSIESQLLEILAHVQPWPDHVLPWPDHATNFLKASWDGLILAGRVAQKNDPQRVEEGLRNYQKSHDQDDDKLLLLMRVVFDLPETRVLGENIQSGGWIIAFGGWMDATGSENRKTNAAWPITWNNGNPKLLVGFAGFQGPRYSAAAEFHYLRGKYPSRNLASYGK